MNCPPVPGPVAKVLSAYEEPVRERLLQVREVIFSVAAETDGVGPLTETLKWGEPAYLTEASGSGSTIRLGIVRGIPKSCAVFFICQTTLIDAFRAHFADELRFEGNRAIILPLTGALPLEPLAFCLRAALTYHQRGTRVTQHMPRSNLDGHF